MTNNIEQKFFETFNISKTSIDFICDKNKCNKKRLMGRFACLECDNETKKEIEVYSEITSDILLELIFIINNYDISNFSTECMNKEDLKNDILEQILFLKSNKYLGSEYKIELINKVQSLFREEGE